MKKVLMGYSCAIVRNGIGEVNHWSIMGEPKIDIRGSDNLFRIWV